MLRQIVKMLHVLTYDVETFQVRIEVLEKH